MSYMKEIERDLDWREAELAALRILMMSSEISPREKLVLYRAGWSLLYAHYEGFCKFALSVYYDNLASLGLNCRDFPRSIRNHALAPAVRELKNSPIHEVIEDILKFHDEQMDCIPSFPEVETQSNLWPSVLGDLLNAADLVIEELEDNKFKLKTLVARRNKIAHGEKDIIVDLAYYEEYEKAFREVAYSLAIQIEKKVELLRTQTV